MALGTALPLLPVAAVGASDAADDAALEEVVVTAQFRQQSLQDTGLAIDALSADTLDKEGITSASQLSQLVPALRINDGGGIQSNIYMRGTGNRANNSYIDPAITLNYDGVAMAQGSSTSLAAFYDLERVEVLKGPQGTLYGRNATGGVVNIIPVRPKLGVTNGFIGGSFGNYDSRELNGAVNVAVGDSAAFRVAASLIKRDGYNDDGTSDDDRKSVRAQWLLKPTDRFELRIAADYTDIGGIGAATTPVGTYAPGTYAFVPSGITGATGPTTAAATAYRQTILNAPGFGFLGPISEQPYVDGQLYGANAELNLGVGDGTLTFIPAFRRVKQDSRFVGPGFNLGWWQNEAKQTSLEARYAGSAGELVDYVAGAYYLKEDQKGNNTFNQEFVLPLQDFTQDMKSWAAFGELTWNLNDTTRLVTGARFTDDGKKMVGGINNFIVFCGGLPPANLTPPASFGRGCAVPTNLPRFPTLDTVDQAYAFLNSNGWSTTRVPIPPGFLIPLSNGVGAILHSIVNSSTSYDETATTYRFSLEKDLLEDSLVYLSFNHGYRGGGLEPTGGVYQPEFLDAYTLGMKNRFLNNRLRFDVEVFYWDYEDQQVTYFNLDANGVLQNTTQNVGKSVNKGFDVDLSWLPHKNTLLSSKIQYLDAKYKDLHFLTSPPRDNIRCPRTTVGVINNVPSYDFDCSNNTAVYSPKWNLSVGIEQTFPLSNGMKVVLGLNSNWTDDQLTGLNNLPHEVIESHTMTNAILTLESDQWQLSAYGRNLEDKHRVQSTQAPLLGVAMTQYNIDMTYGLSFRYRFGD